MGRSWVRLEGSWWWGCQRAEKTLVMWVRNCLLGWFRARRRVSVSLLTIYKCTQFSIIVFHVIINSQKQQNYNSHQFYELSTYFPSSSYISEFLIIFKYNQEQMDQELALTRKQIQRRRQLLNNLIVEKKNRCREVLGKNDNVIELINLELQNLKLQFQKEQIKEKNPCELRGQNKTKGCCCLVLDQNEFVEISSHSKEMVDYLTIRGTRDFFTKLQKLQKREEELGSCKCECCHDTALLLACEVGDCNKVIDSIVPFYCLFGWLIYLIGAMILLPGVCLYRLCEWCSECCSRRGSRTSRILKVYRSYLDKIEDIYPPLDRT